MYLLSGVGIVLPTEWLANSKAFLMIVLNGYVGGRLKLWEAMYASTSVSDITKGLG